MELRHLRYFVAIAEMGSLLKASERLHVAQPALSVCLANLEEEIGTRLVTRSNRGVELTQDGAFLYERAIETLRYHQESIASLKERKTTPSGQVSIGMLSTMPALLAPVLASAVRASLPDVTLYVVDASTSALYEWLTEGRIDMVMLFNLQQTPELDAVPLFCEAFYLVGAPGSEHAFKHPERIDFDDIVELPLATPSVSTTWRKALDEAAERRNKVLKPVIETESTSALKALATAGECFAVVPGSCIAEEVRSGSLQARRIVNPDMVGMVSVVSLSSSPLGKAAARVREIVVEVTRETYGALPLTLGSGAVTEVRPATPTTLFPNNQNRRRPLKVA